MSEGAVSHWMAGGDRRDDARPALDGAEEADVCIVGAGFTGLWTAYFLASAKPDLRIVVVEARYAGFGASGRNGGWLTGALPGHPAVFARTGGVEGVRALQAQLDATVDDVAAVLRAEAIDADLRKGGELCVARSPAAVQRMQAGMRQAERWGVDQEWLDAQGVSARIAIDGALGGTFSPHCASLDPGKLVRGLAAAVEARGVRILEHSPVTEVASRRVRTERGEVRAEHVVIATEGFTCSLPDRRRRLLPVNSSMIITRPIDPAILDRVGWRHGETLSDGAHVYIYAQRTVDDRIAIGGRGVPYVFGNGFDPLGRTPRATVDSLQRTLVSMFPALRGVTVADAWSGVLGVPRDWTASVGRDPTTGIASAGGYTGHGVAASQLAGRTLADLVLGQDTPRTRLPWVGRRSPTWEPEPIRWLGVRGMYATYRLADRMEARPGAGPSRLGRFADLVSGKP